MKTRGVKNFKKSAVARQNLEQHQFQVSKRALSACVAAKASIVSRSQKKRNLFKSQVQKSKEETIYLKEIPTIQADQSRLFSAESTRKYIQQLENQYSFDYGAIKLKFSSNFFNLTNDLFPEALVSCKTSIGASASRYEKIAEGVFRKQEIGIEEVNIKALPKSFSQKSFWDNISSVKTIHYGDLQEVIIKKFGQIFPNQVLSFKEVFPQKIKQTINESKFGRQGSTFGFHLDPYNLVGLNLLRTGGRKLWYIIPNKHQQTMRRMLLQLPTKQNQIPCARVHFSTLYHPEKIKQLGHSTIQKKGELIVLFSGVFHSGINLQPNISLTGSIATSAWLNQNFQAPCRCPFQLTKIMISKMRREGINYGCTKDQTKSQAYLTSIKYDDKLVFGKELPVISQQMDNDLDSNSQIVKAEIERGIYELNQAIQQNRKRKIQVFKQQIGYNQVWQNGFCFYSPSPISYYTQFIFYEFKPQELFKVNDDQSPFTPFFLLNENQIGQNFSSEAKYYNLLSRIQNEGDSEVQQNFFLPKPRKNRCQVCRKIFSDYIKHTSSKRHLKQIKKMNLQEEIQSILKKK